MAGAVGETCGGQIKSGSGHIRFPTSGISTNTKQRCEWTIEVPSGLRIELIFEDFLMKTTCCSCVNDYLEIRDGLDENSTVIGERFCAKTRPEKVYSTSNTLRLRFVSNFQTYRGNKVRLSFRSMCGHHLTDSSGIFKSPNYPAVSDMNQVCLYTISVPRGRLKVTFDKFDLQGKMPSCDHDVLEVKEAALVATSRDDRPIRRYCGKENIPVVYSTEGSSLWLRLKTDVSGSGLFFARYRTISVGEGTCGGYLRASAGQIYSHNFPFQFPANEECIWKIEVAKGKHIHLYFDTLEFSHQGDLDCQFASVTIYDDLEMEFVISEHCRNGHPRVIISRTNVMTLHAQSDGIHSPGWFSLWYVSSEKGPCPSAKFTCRDRKCIAAKLQCDGKADCSDGYDEEDCPRKTPSLAWYNFWPVTVVVVVVFVGVWLWRTWQRYKSLRSNMQSNACMCASSCQHSSSHTLEVIEPPTYDEAVSQPRPLPPSYEEAVQSQQEVVAMTDTSNSLMNTETPTNPSQEETSDDEANAVSLQPRDDGGHRVEFHALRFSLGSPYESHRPPSYTARNEPQTQ